MNEATWQRMRFARRPKAHYPALVVVGNILGSVGVVMRKLVVAVLILAGVIGEAWAQSKPQPQPQETPAEKPLYRFPGLPDEPLDAQGNRRPRLPPGQLFVSPVGEPFRAPPAAPYPIVNWFNQADADHDGKLDRPEFSADFERFFNLLDVNHDGVIDADEVARYEREIVPEVSIPSFGDGPGGGGFPRGGPPPGGRPPANARLNAAGGQGRPQQGGPPPGGPDGPVPPSVPGEIIAGAGVYGIINIPEPVSSMDINLDGRVTRAEMVAASYRRFALLDVERRGYLRLGDLPRTLAQSQGLGKRKPRRGRDFPDF